MTPSRRTPTPHDIGWDVVSATALEYASKFYRLDRIDESLVVNDGERQLEVGAYASAADAMLTLKLTPGCQTYLEARSYHGNPVADRDLVAAAIVATIGGHPDAEDRAGTRLSAVWSHHLAIIGGDDPRRVASMYAPTETKTIAAGIQDMAALGVRLVPPSGP